MKVGTAQLDITPEPGIDLAGFALRPQPSTAVLDRLAVRGLYLEHGPERVLWLHADLLAFDQELTDRWRDWIEVNLGIPRTSVLISTTHTHSGPATIQLTGCGQVRSEYIAWLEERMRSVARSALAETERCRLIAVEGSCRLGVDRRESACAHTDPRVAALAWQRENGTFKAVFLGYAMHPVCLRSSVISADWPGEAARRLCESLPGEPLALISSGACGNIDPPGVGVSPDQMRAWGGQVSASILPMLQAAAAQPDLPNGRPLGVVSTSIELPVESWKDYDINRYAASCLADTAGEREFSDKFRSAVQVWQTSMKQRLRHGAPDHTRAELTAIALGESVIVTVNAEVFSRFSELATTGQGPRVYTVSCANGMIGYLPSSEAYAEPTYEVLWSMLFYNMPRLRQGSLELLARRARELIAVWPDVARLS